MANIELLIPKILHWEGGFVQDPLDKGGATNMGVTIATFRTVFGKDKSVDDLKAMTKDQFTQVLKHFYWDRWKADQIDNQSVAEILVDWVWASGKWGIILPQRILKTKDDGIAGPNTITLLNTQDQERFFILIKNERIEFVNEIVTNNSSQERFLQGWTNRIDSYEFSL